MLCFDFHGVTLSAADFPRDVRGRIAFRIAFSLNTRCCDKAAVLELLLSEADSIIDEALGRSSSDKPLPERMEDMTEPQLSEHLSRQLRFIKARQTADTVGSMLVIFQNNGITQYGATIAPDTAPQALRELADRLERRETVKRG